MQLLNAKIYITDVYHLYSGHSTHTVKIVCYLTLICMPFIHSWQLCVDRGPQCLPWLAGREIRLLNPALHLLSHCVFTYFVFPLSVTTSVDTHTHSHTQKAAGRQRLSSWLLFFCSLIQTQEQQAERDKHIDRRPSAYFLLVLFSKVLLLHLNRAP